MSADLPPGKWSATLVGTWWPQAATGMRQSAQHWGTAATAQENYAQGLRSQRDTLSRNQGKTAEDLIARFHLGEKFHLDLAEKYGVKRRAFNSAGDAIDNLRSGLSGIAAEYNEKIAKIESQITVGNSVAAAAQITQLITEAQSFAAHKSATAVAAIADAMQKVLAAEGVAMSSQEFLQSQGLSTDAARPDAQNAAHDVLGDAFRQPDTGTGETSRSTTAELGDAFRQPTSSPDTGAAAPQPTLAATPTAELGDAFGAAPATTIATDAGASLPAAGAVSASPSATTGAAVPASASPALPGLGESFASGAAAGQPAAAGAESVSSAAMNAGAPNAQTTAAGSHPGLLSAAPVVGGVSSGGGVEHALASGAAPPASAGSGGAVAPVTPVAAGPVLGHIAPPAVAGGGGVASPAGPLPAYGSDLRPPVVAPPTGAAGGPVGPAGGAPVAPTSAHSAGGGAVVSPVGKRAAAAAAAAAQAGSGGMSSAGAAAGAAAGVGAAAGDAGWRAGEQQQLDDKVAAVARQEPRVAWAAGLRDDRTTVMVTDLASGWIPPHVQLPGGVKLLEPVRRRGDVSDLLGTVVLSAHHKPNSYIPSAGPDEPPPGSGERARYGHQVEELGPSLVAAARRMTDGLPRLVLTAAAQATRNGLAPDEIQALDAILDDYRARVLDDYPRHGSADVSAWMLLAAVEAALAGRRDLAAYHLTWLTTAATKPEGVHGVPVP